MNNDREEARVAIKKITDFNIANNYYQKEEKEEIVREFKKLLFVDDVVVRKFLESWILSTKKLAIYYDLLGTSSEVNKSEEQKSDEEEVEEKVEDENVEQKETENKEEKSKEIEKETEEKAPELPENFDYKLFIKRAGELI